MDTKQAERAIIAGLEELGWATKVGLAELDGVHGKVNVALKRLITAGKAVRAKAGIAARRLPCVESADCVRDSAKDIQQLIEHREPYVRQGMAFRHQGQERIPWTLATLEGVNRGMPNYCGRQQPNHPSALQA